MKKKDIKKMIKVAEGLGWSVHVNGKEFTFEKFSPAGQDFNFSITIYSLEDAIEKIHDRCDNFDCSEETYLWLDDTGHGKKGAPYDMKDVYEDIEACLEMMEELRDALKKLNQESCD